MLIARTSEGGARTRWSLRDLVAPAVHGSAVSRARVRATMSLGAGAAVLLTAWATPQPGLAVLWALAAAAFGLLALVPRLHAVWDRSGGITAIGMIWLLVWLTGETHSPYVVLYLVNALFGAFYYLRRRFVLETGVTAVALLSPLALPGGAAEIVVAELLMRAVTYVLLAGFVHVLVGRLRTTKRELSVNEQRYRSLFTDSPDPVWAVDADGYFTSVNAAAVAFSGWDEEQLVGKHFGELVAPEEAEFSTASFDGAMRGYRTATQRTLITRSGERRTLEASGVPIRVDGEIVGAFGVGKDVTERLQMEVELQRREAEYRETAENLEALVAASPIAILEMDTEGRVTRWNAAAERTFGWSEEEVLGGPLPFVTDDQHDSHQAFRARVLDGGVLVDQTATRTRRDGTSIEVAIYAAPRYDADGAVAGIVSFTADLTDRLRLEQQLRQAQKMEAVGRLAGGVAHDFNNILSVILGSAEMLLEDLPDDDPRREDATEVLEAARRGADVVRQLLRSAPHGGSGERAVDLRVVVRGEADLMARTLGSDRNLEVQLPREPVMVRIDPSDVQRILLNLVMNARAATEDGGTVVIALAADASSGSGCLVVEDDGIGMDADTQERMFEPFFTTKPTGEGVGLGLATVYGIVERHHGSLLVDSEPGRGTRIEVRFATASPTGSVDGTGVGRGAVLVVDDEEAVRQLTARTLERHGYDVMQASGPVEALEIADLHGDRIGLLVTDVVMPVMDGPELAARMRRSIEELPVAYVSGFARSRLRVELEGRRERFLSKPVERGTLLRTVAELLSRADATADAKR